jgi:hypothetical protein
MNVPAGKKDAKDTANVRNALNFTKQASTNHIAKEKKQRLACLKREPNECVLVLKSDI